MTITVSPFTTSRDAKGAYSLTLAQLTSVFLAEIEKLFGPRDSKFTYVGLEIDTTQNAKPRIWFPHTGYPGRDSDKPSQHIAIRLTANAQNDANIAIWQLAHECVHLIDPWDVEVEGRQPSVLEEGLAAWYQNTIVQGVSLDDDPSYEEAKSLVEPYVPELAATIKHIRTQHKIRISDIDDPDLLLTHCRNMSPKTAENLCHRFPSRFAGAVQ